MVDVRKPLREVPQHMQGDGGTYARQTMHLCGIAELLLDSAGCRRLKELAKASPGVSESP